MKSKGHWTFFGNLDPVQMAAFYPNLDVLTVPSLNSTEAFGLVQIEAMMNGVPSVPSALPGVRRPVQMHGMGLVSQIGDSASLANQFWACWMIPKNIAVILKPSRNPMTPIQSRRNMKNCLQNLWDNFKALFMEVAIESKCGINAVSAHGVET